MNLTETSTPKNLRPQPSRRSGAPPDTGFKKPAWPVAITGVAFDNVTLTETVDRIMDMIVSGHPHYVVTANVDFLVQALTDVELRRILHEADLVLCDGTPIVWASRWLGNPLKERVAGADLVPLLIREAARQNRRVFLLGAGEGVAERAAEHLTRAHPSLLIAGHYSPPFNALLEMDHVEAARRIRAARPDVLLVSFGCPKQEKWISMHYRSLGVPVVIGVGATLDFIADRVRRAPAWMQRSGLEWGFRLAQEPRRLFRRYANDLTRFAPALLSQKLALSPPRGTFTRMSGHPSSFTNSSWMQIWAPEALTVCSISANARFWSEAFLKTCHCLLDASRVSNVDSTGVALLSRWRQRLHVRGYQLVLLSPSPALSRALGRLQLEDRFLVAANWAKAQGVIKSRETPPRPVTFNGSPRPLSWKEEVTAANVDEVWALTIELLRALGPRRRPVLIDLSRVRFIDSSGVGLMLRLSKWALQHDTEVRFTDPQPAVLNVLKLTRLDSLLLQPY